MLAKSEWEEENARLYGGRGLRNSMLQDGLKSKQAPPNWALDLFGRVIILALRPYVEQACRFVYPKRPQEVDKRLVDNIVRDSKDPGGYSVIAAGAKLPTPITKNELLHAFGKPLLVAQGLNDPLGGGIAKQRYALYTHAHPHPDKVLLVGLDAGHCPQHELANEVAAEIKKFMASLPSHGSRSGT
jgi:pimeloyl-ACP methyl ester carboxylesterase